MTDATRVTVWNEHVNEFRKEAVAKLYPHGLHTAIADGLRGILGDQATVRTATLDQPGQGLPKELIDSTDVLVWWAHIAHDQVPTHTVDALRNRVLAGMGLIVLHSGCFSRIFLSLMGTSCNLRWRKTDDRELIWTVHPTHPIANGVPHPLVLERHEMYGEYFDIPQPDELVFISSYTGGEVFRSGCCFYRGNGRIFYFSPGDESYPIYYEPGVLRVLANAVIWAHNRTPSDLVLPIPTRSPASWFHDDPQPSAARP